MSPSTFCPSVDSGYHGKLLKKIPLFLRVKIPPERLKKLPCMEMCGVDEILFRACDVEGCQRMATTTRRLTIHLCASCAR